MSRRLDEEGTLADGPPARYCYIVAKFVFLEYLRSSKRAGTSVPIDVETSVRIPMIDDVDREQHLSCLDRCLDALSGNDRELILEYYGGGTERNAERRRRLAAGLGLTPNALMIRACRIRDRLEACVRSCVAAR